MKEKYKKLLPVFSRDDDDAFTDEDPKKSASQESPAEEDSIFNEDMFVNAKTEAKESPADDAAEDEEGASAEAEEGLMTEEELNDLEDAKLLAGDADRDHVWAFISGHYSQDFVGNPKYMFVYVNKYRKDIKPYWICSDPETIAQVKALGFHAYQLQTPAAQYISNRTGVVVVEQVKYTMPDGFSNVKFVNLWHGVGFKHVERKINLGDIDMTFAKKYIRRGTQYRDYQLVNATCPFIEEAYTDDLGVDADKFMRVGYPRCLYQQNFEPVATYDHDLRARKGLSPDAKLVVYTPTYRAKLGGTFSRAITDFDRLYKFCEENNILFIFKVHPNMEKEVGFLSAWETYGDLPHFLFWDNRDDFYEVMHAMDLAIIDYSSIVSEMVAMGIKHYIRYIFDYEEYVSTSFVFDNYFEMTTGEICRSFDELIEAMRTFESRDESAEIARLNEALWSYSHGKDDFERIIAQVFAFHPVKREFPNLYSFDVFDTLFTRKVLDPAGIFYCVKEKMIEDGGFSYAFANRYPLVRASAESNVREYYAKSVRLRGEERVEITFDEIFDRIQYVYGCTDEQIAKLKAWELEAELENVVPLPKQIDRVKELLANNETVVLISDMYLPKDFIEKLLYKADPVLTQLPLFLSNEYGVLKTSQKLYFEVYKSFQPYYDFKKWIHYGDNTNADVNQARQFKICARKVEKPAFNKIQAQLVRQLNSYDGYLVAAMQARLCGNRYFKTDAFVASYISLCFVPYIDWVLRDAERRGFETLYFISRDGYHLKRIADKIIERRGLKFKTKLIYASRRTWRIPSFVKEVDDDFWQDHGSFGNIASKEKLLSAMDLTEELFAEFFPYIDIDNIDFSNRQEMLALREIFKESEEYNKYLLQTAAKERVIVNGYLKQEIDPNEKFAFVEYYGRGYTQDCLVNLWRDVTGDDTAEIVFYYSRSVLPSAKGAIRLNFTTNNEKQYFIESIFANMPYKSVQAYYTEDGVIKPVIEPIDCDRDLFDSMNRILPAFAEQYAGLELRYPEDTDRLLYDFLFSYFKSHLEDPAFAEQIGSLIDCITLYGDKREFAPAFTQETLEKFAQKELFRNSLLVTTSISMSVTRTDPAVRRKYEEMYQILPGESAGAGRLLDESEIKKNKKFRKKYEGALKRAQNFSALYNEAVKTAEVEDNVLILSEGKSMTTDQVDVLDRRLRELTGKNVKTLLMKNCAEADDDALAREAAAAKYIIVNSPAAILCKTVFRPETKEILALPTPFTLYNKGLLQEISLKWEKQYKTLVAANDISVLQLPSAATEDFYKRCFCEKRDVDTSLKGSYMTDVYFDADYQRQAEEKLVALFPEAAGKKRLLYMPKVRMRHECEKWLNMLDLEILQRLIGDEYVVLLRMNKAGVEEETVNAINIEGFSRRIDKGMSLREMMVVSDVVVGDYNDTFFETPILRKPAFATDGDCEEFLTGGNRSYHANSYDAYKFCPTVGDAYELAERLQTLGSFDFTAMDRFRETYLTHCDGHSIERLAEVILSDRAAEGGTQPGIPQF